MGEAWLGRAVGRTLARLVLLQSPLVPRQILPNRRWHNGGVEDGLIKDFLLSHSQVMSYKKNVLMRIAAFCDVRADVLIGKLSFFR